MTKNADLSNAKNAKKDEFYTQLEDINAEMVHYENKRLISDDEVQTVRCFANDITVINLRIK